MAINLHIVATDRIIFEGEAEYVKVRTTEGALTILKRHIPLVAILEIAPLFVKLPNVDKERELAVSSGYILVEDDNEVIVVTDIAEWAEEIDLDRAQAEADRAKRLLDGKELGDVNRAQVSLKKALNRLNVREHSEFNK